MIQCFQGVYLSVKVVLFCKTFVVFILLEDTMQSGLWAIVIVKETAPTKRAPARASFQRKR